LGCAANSVQPAKFGAKPIEFEKGKAGIMVSSKDCARGDMMAAEPRQSVFLR